MSSISTSTAGRWAAAGALGLAGAAAVGALAGFARPDHYALTALVFAGCTLPPLLALGWLLLVAPRTVRPDPHAEDNVERAWFERACSGAFTDLLALTGLGLAATAILDLAPDAQLVLLTVLVAAMADATARYVLLVRRERLAEAG